MRSFLVLLGMLCERAFDSRIKALHRDEARWICPALHVFTAEFAAPLALECLDDLS